MLIHFLLLNSIFLFFMGGFAYLKSRSKFSKLFFFLNVGVAVWNLSAYTITIHAHFLPLNSLSHIQHISALVFTLMIFLFTAEFSKTKTPLLTWLFSLVTIIFSVFILFNKITVLTLVENKLVYTDTFGYTLYALFILILFIFICINLFKAFRNEKILKYQAIALLSGIGGLFALGATFNLLLPILGNNDFLVLGYFGTTILSVAFAFAIAKQHLFDLKVIITRFVAHCVLILGITFSFSGLNLGACCEIQNNQ